MAFRLLSLLTLIALSFASCSESSFTGADLSGKNADEKKKKEKKDKPSDDDDDDGSSDDPIELDGDGGNQSEGGGDDLGSDDLGSDDSSASDDSLLGEDGEFTEDLGKVYTDDEVVTMRRNCWFAVSGAHLGFRGNNNGSKSYYEYAPKFPGTTSGNPISHGETFDTVGGVYLNARTEPFVYGSGGREIDLAVDNSFDSIAVAPGMRVEIKDGSGKVLYSGDGPYIANATTSDSLSGHPALYKTAVEGAPNAPAWIKAHMESLVPAYKLPRIDLRSARWVQVSRIAGKRCE